MCPSPCFVSTNVSYHRILSMNYIYKVLGINWFKHTLAWPKGSFVPCNKAKDQLPLFSIADDSLFC